MPSRSAGGVSAKVLHGLATVRHINEERMRRSAKQIAQPCIRAPAVISVLLGSGPTMLVAALAGANLVYWLVVALALDFGGTVVSTVGVALPLGLWSKEFVLANGTVSMLGDTILLLLSGAIVLVIGAVVTKLVAPYAIVAGNPARVIDNRAPSGCRGLPSDGDA